MHQVSCTTLGALKNVKFRLSRNLTKFDVVARFRKTIQTDFDRNYHFTIFQKNSNFLGFYKGLEKEKKIKKQFEFLCLP